MSFNMFLLNSTYKLQLLGGTIWGSRGRYGHM